MAWFQDPRSTLYVTFAIAVLAADGRNRQLVQAADKTSCGEGLYCGGGTCPGGKPVTDLACQISCGPWPVKEAKYTRDAPYCTIQEVYEFAGPKGLAQAWVSPDQPNNINKNYWVFHGCDGTGLMMGDCGGGTFHIEQFGPLATGAREPLALPPVCIGNPDPACAHTRPQAYQHPGTRRLYEWFNVGMWTTGEDNKWPDQKGVGSDGEKPWWAAMGIPDIPELGPVPGRTAFTVMFPWVCNYAPGGDDWSWFWADMRPFGNATRNVKCYADNEPWDVYVNKDAHYHSKLLPPTWQVYKFYRPPGNASQVVGWKLAEKSVDNAKGPFWIKDPAPFYLDALDMPAW